MSNYCTQCNKQYSSYQSWWNHNKKFHNDDNPKIIQNQSNNNPNIIQIQSKSNPITLQQISCETSHNTINKLSCKYCKNPPNLT